MGYIATRVLNTNFIFSRYFMPVSYYGMNMKMKLYHFRTQSRFWDELLLISAFFSRAERVSTPVPHVL